MSEPNPQTLARELERLDEEAPSAEELKLVSGPLEADVGVATVAALVELSRPREFEDLSELEQARAWRNVEGRMGHGTVTTGAPSRRRPWALVAVGLAAAAAVTFVLVRPGVDATEDQHEMAVALQTQARQGLTTLGVEPGGESRRAHDMVRDYETRLLASEGAG